MKILIIHLEWSSERKALMNAEMKRMRWSAEYVSAIDGLDGDFTHVDYCYRTAVKLFGRGLSAREAACCLSHARAWERVAASTEPALILEDDCLFAKSPECIEERWKALPDSFDFVHFQRNDGWPVVAGEIREPYQRCLRVPYGACAIAVSPKGARELLRRAFPIAEPVDVFLARVSLELEAYTLAHGEYLALPAPVSSLINE